MNVDRCRTTPGADVGASGPAVQRFARLLVAVAWLSSCAGCREPLPVPAGKPLQHEPSLATQAEAVRQGRSDEVRLDQTVVRDDDLALLDGLKDKLRRINLSNTEITDAGLSRLSELSNLEQLRLSSRRITDAGLAHIAKLEHLRFLHLLDMPVTDAGLASLHGMTNLESLYLDRTSVTDEGLGRLVEALPAVHLHVDEHHHRLDPQADAHRH